MCVGLSRFVYVPVYITANIGLFATGQTSRIAAFSGCDCQPVSGDRSKLAFYCCDCVDCSIACGGFVRLTNDNLSLLLGQVIEVLIDSCCLDSGNLEVVSRDWSTRTTMDGLAHRTTLATLVDLPRISRPTRLDSMSM